jgi:hypothetical protein
MTYVARVRSTIALCAIGALLEPPIATAQPNKISDKYVVVNGMLDPAAIPEYAAWRHALNMFSLREQRTSSELRDELELPAVEYALLATEAGQEKVRRDACHQRQARVTEEGKQAGWRPSRLQEAIDSVVLECRQAILDAAERLMAKLSDDGKHKVSEFIERSKSTLEMFVEKDRLAFFRQPR